MQIQNGKNAFPRHHAVHKGLGQRIDTREGIKQKTPGNKESHQSPFLHFPFENPVGCRPHHRHDSCFRDQRHSRPGHRIGFSHGELSLLYLGACPVKPVQLLWLHRVGFDLADTGNVVVQHGVERTAGLGGRPVAGFVPTRIKPSRQRHEGHGGQGDQRQPHMLVKHPAQNDDKLQNPAQSLVDAVDDHLLNRRHITPHTRHDVPRRLVVEPPHRQPLDFVIQLPPQVMHHHLLKNVVAQHPYRENNLPQGNRPHRQQGRGPDRVPLLIGNDVIDKPLCHRRHHQHQQGAGNREKKSQNRPPPVAGGITKYAAQGAHKTFPASPPAPSAVNEGNDGPFGSPPPPNSFQKPGPIRIPLWKNPPAWPDNKHRSRGEQP